MTQAIQILGLCRFSVPSAGGFRSGPEEASARRAWLYEPRRLDERLAWFRHVALPGIAGQRDADFTLVLLTGADLPEPWRSELRALVAGVPQIVVTETEPGPHREICAAALRPHVQAGTAALAQFRLDDDDAVATGFTARVRADLEPVLGLLGRRRQFAVDYARGIVLRWERGCFHPEARRARQWTPALVHVSRPDLGRFILDIDHSRMWWHMPVLSWADEFMWVRGAHAGNDSRISPPGRDAIDLPPERLEALLAARFGVSPAALGRRLLDIAAAHG